MESFPNPNTQIDQIVSGLKHLYTKLAKSDQEEASFSSREDEVLLSLKQLFLTRTQKLKLKRKQQNLSQPCF